MSIEFYPRLTETLIFPAATSSEAQKVLRFRAVDSDSWKKVYEYGGRVQLWFTSSSAGWIGKDFNQDGSLDLDVDVEAGWVEFTYRIIWKDGYVNWLGSQGGNGHIVFSSSSPSRTGWKIWAATSEGITAGQGSEDKRVLVPNPDFKPHSVYMPDPIFVGEWDSETKDGFQVISTAGSDSVLVLPSPSTTITTATTWYDPSKRSLAKEVEKTGSVFVQGRVEENVGVVVLEPSGWTRVQKPATTPSAAVEPPTPATVSVKPEPVIVEPAAPEPPAAVEPDPPSPVIEPTRTVTRRPSALELQTITRDHGTMLGFAKYIFTFAGLYLATLLTLLFGARPIQRRDTQERERETEEEKEWEIEQVEVVEKAEGDIEVKPVEEDQDQDDDKSSVVSSTIAETESFKILLPSPTKPSLVYAFYPPSPNNKVVLHNEEGQELEPVALGGNLYEVRDASGIVTFSL